MGSSQPAPTQRCVQDPSAGQRGSALHRVVPCWPRWPRPLPLPDLPHLTPGPDAALTAQQQQQQQQRREAQRGRQLGAGHTERRSTRGALYPERSHHALGEMARGAAELSWPGRGRLYPRPEPQEAAPLPRRGWHGGGHVGGGLQGESLPHPRLARPGAPWPTLASSSGCRAGQLPRYPVNRDPLPTPD